MKKLLLITCLLSTNYCHAQWIQLELPTNAAVVSSSFITDVKGWIGTTNSGQTFIYHTSNGGLTWNTLTVTSGANDASYVCFVSPTTGYVVVNTIAIKTIDDGLTWDPMESMYFPAKSP